jgi:hypothetical protein
MTQNSQAFTQTSNNIAQIMKTPGQNGPIYLLTDEHLLADSLMRTQFNLPQKVAHNKTPYSTTGYERDYQVHTKKPIGASFSETTILLSENKRKSSRNDRNKDTRLFQF